MRAKDAPTRRGWRAVVRHQLGAAAATAADFGIMIACVQAGLPPVAGTAVGAAGGASLNFALGRHWIFPTGSPERVHVQAIRYGVVSLASLALNALGEFVLHDVGRLHYVVARALVAGVVGLAWNYPLQREWVFAGRANQKFSSREKPLSSEEDRAAPRETSLRPRSASP